MPDEISVYNYYFKSFLTLLIPIIKTFKIIEDTDTVPMEKNIISVHERSFKLS
jgi:hypothetical protein